MAQLLHINASPRGEQPLRYLQSSAHSRRLTGEFVAAWKQTHPADLVTDRDIGRNPVPHVYEAWIAAGYTHPEQRTPEMWEALRISDQLVDEFLAADIYIVGVSMYNFSIPSAFKAYIDQIVRIGRTFAFTPENAESITDITLIEVENDESGGQKLADAIANAQIQMAQLVGG